jgi:hypothetical protein
MSNPSAAAQNDPQAAPAAFAGAEMVLKRGKIFEAGDFGESHGFSLTPEEMRTAADTYKPGSAVVRDAHPKRGQSYLEGKFGAVERIAVNPDNPNELLADVNLAKWYADLLPEGELSVSAEWSRDTKELVGLGVLTNPHIEDASIFAAFAKATHNTPEGQRLIQNVHDLVSGGGAVCDDPATWAAKHEATAAQQIHQLCTQNGAHCRAMAPGRSGSDAPLYFGKDEAHVASGAAVAFSVASEQKGRLMSVWDGLREWFKKDMAGEPSAEVIAAFAAAGATVADPAAAQAAAETGKEGGMNEAERKELAEAKRIALEERGKRIEAEATAFADVEVAAHRAYPSEREDMVVAYQQAATDDSNSPATFGGEGTSRVAQLKKRHAARPPHALTKETENLTAEELAEFMKQPLRPVMTTPHAGAEKPMDKTRHDRLMEMSDVGRDTLRNGASKN